MDSYGKTIARLRKENGLTQNELGAQLNVTYQAVSKWENDLSQPDFDTIIAMCKIFKISVDDFTRLSTGEEVQTETAVSDVAAPAADTLADAPAVETVESAEPTEEVPAKRKRRCNISAGYLTGFILSIVAGIAVGAALCFFIPWYFALAAGYVTMSFIALMGHESVVWEVLIGGLTKSVHIPGVIFTLDINGIFFLIVYKFIIAPIATAFIWLFFALGAIILSILMSGFIYPFKLPRIIKDAFFKER